MFSCFLQNYKMCKCPFSDQVTYMYILFMLLLDIEQYRISGNFHSKIFQIRQKKYSEYLLLSENLIIRIKVSRAHIKYSRWKKEPWLAVFMAIMCTKRLESSHWGKTSNRKIRETDMQWRIRRTITMMGQF